MRLGVSMALAVGALAITLSPAAKSADLEDYPRHEQRGESPYDDPRYRYLYGEDEPAPPRYAAPPPAYRYEPSYKDERLPPMPVPPRFSEHRHAAPGCIPKREIRARLMDRGWGGFHDIEIRGEVAYVKAQRPSGRMFDLEIDRCSGHVLSARPVGEPPRPYAWGAPHYPRGY